MALAATAKERLSGVALNDVGPVIGAKGLKAIDGYLGRDPVFERDDDAARRCARYSWSRSKSARAPSAARRH